MNQYQDYSTYTPARAELLNGFMRGVYGWMALGLLTTAVVAYLTASTPAILGIFVTQTGISPLFWVVLLAELGLVWYLSARINSLSGTTATALFLLYSGLNGLTLSFLLLVYTTSEIFTAFVTTAGMFGAMSLYGMITKKDLTSWGSFLFMGLIGIIIASLVNFFLQSGAMSLVISVIGVIVFLGLTAYDTQKLKVMGQNMPLDDATVMRRGSILGALTLYLDFINLFLFILRILGASRD